MRVILLLLVVACGDNLAPAPSSDNTSGTRLKLHWFEYDNGTRQLASPSTMFDADRNEECTVTWWSDGRAYCTPATSIASYMDAACTVEVGRVSDDPMAPRYLQHVFFLDGDELPSRLYEIGERVGRVAQLFEMIGDDCIPAPFDPGGEYATLGAEVPKEMLAGVSRHELPSDGPVAIRVATSHDGMVVQVGGVDQLLGNCSIVERAGAKQTFCVPEIKQFTSDFLDDSCTEPAFVLSAGVDVPDLVRVDARPDEVDIRPLGELTTKHSVFGKRGDRCVEEPVVDFTRVFRLGDRVNVPELARVRGDGDRIHPIVDGVGLVDPLLYDAVLDVDCRSTTFRGETRCFPSTVPLETRFGDAACSQPVNLALEPVGIAPMYAQGQTALGDLRIYPVLGPSPTVYERTTGDDCAEALIPDGMMFYTVGDAIPIGSFAAATAVTE